MDYRLRNEHWEVLMYLRRNNNKTRSDIMLKLGISEKGLYGWHWSGLYSRTFSCDCNEQ